VLQNPITGRVWHKKLYLGYMENQHGFHPVRDPGVYVALPQRVQQQRHRAVPIVLL
jgi:hypothetical protein